MNDLERFWELRNGVHITNIMEIYGYTKKVVDFDQRKLMSEKIAGHVT